MYPLLVLCLSLVLALSQRAHWVPNGTHCSYHQVGREVNIRCDNLSGGMFEQPRTRSDNMDILLYPSTGQKTKEGLHVEFHGLYGVLADFGEIPPYALRIRPPVIVCAPLFQWEQASSDHCRVVSICARRPGGIDLIAPFSREDGSHLLFNQFVKDLTPPECNFLTPRGKPHEFVIDIFVNHTAAPADWYQDLAGHVAYPIKHQPDTPEWGKRRQEWVPAIWSFQVNCKFKSRPTA